MSDQIKVEITGPAGVGKTTVAELVTETLRRYGLTVTNNDDDKPVGPLHKRLENIGKSAEVVVDTTRTLRDGSLPSVRLAE